MEDVARLLCQHPADFLGLKLKGRIAPGCDADLVVWDPEASFVVKEEMVEHRHKLTPYVGMRQQGIVERTLISGTPVFVVDTLTGPFASTITNGNERA